MQFDFGDRVLGVVLVDDGQGTRVAHPRREVVGTVCVVYARQPGVVMVDTADGGAFLVRVIERIDSLRAAVTLVVRALREPGPSPRTHRTIQRRHAREWPTLWTALDALAQEYDAPRERRLTDV